MILNSRIGRYLYRRLRPTYRRLHSFLICMLLGSVLASCALMSRERKPEPEAPEVSEDAREILSEEQIALSQLRGTVNSEIALSEATRGAQTNLVRYDHPYYHVSFEIFPDGEGNFSSSVAETGQSLTPWSGTVIIRKVKVSTRFHRNRADAAADENLIRDEGVERRRYQYQNGRWVLQHSVFEVTRTEVLEGDLWVAPVEPVTRFADEERGIVSNWIQRIFRR